MFLQIFRRYCQLNLVYFLFWGASNVHEHNKALPVQLHGEGSDPSNTSFPFPLILRVDTSDWLIMNLSHLTVFPLSPSQCWGYFHPRKMNSLFAESSQLLNKQLHEQELLESLWRGLVINTWAHKKILFVHKPILYSSFAHQKQFSLSSRRCIITLLHPCFSSASRWTDL